MRSVSLKRGAASSATAATVSVLCGGYLIVPEY